MTSRLGDEISPVRSEPVSSHLVPDMIDEKIAISSCREAPLLIMPCKDQGLVPRLTDDVSEAFMAPKPLVVYINLPELQQT